MRAKDRIRQQVSEAQALKSRVYRKYAEMYPDSKHFIRLLTMMHETKVGFLKDWNIGLTKKVLGLAEQLGAKLRRVNSMMFDVHTPYRYDGEYITYSLRSWNSESTDSLLHEICHWQCAPAQFRFTPDYSLGGLRYSDRKTDALRDARPIADRTMDEALTVIMAALWRWHWGYKSATNIDQDFTIYTPKELWDTEITHAEVWDLCLEKLMQSGLIDKDFTPRPVARVA